MIRISFFILSLFFLFLVSCDTKKDAPPYQNTDLSVDERVEDLVSRMTLEQKIAQLNYDAPAIDSLGIQKYNWWNECLHGVARSGLATVFPQAIGLAASWDTDMMSRVGEAISDEGRAKYHDFQRKDKRGIYQGITFWTPNINIFRDPRWGRGMETYGECPYLTGEMAVRFINALQGNDPDYLKSVATAKHYAVHSGPEPDRHSFNALASDYDLWETYMPAFQKCVEEADVHSVMCAYNRFRGKPCCGSDPLLDNILRSQWGFDGYVVSDCWAIQDFFGEERHDLVEGRPEAAAMAFNKGTDLNCGNSSPALAEAVERGLIDENQIDVALKRLMKARFKLGMFDPQEMVPFADIPYDVVDNEKHRQLALEAAQKSMVLLKNEDNLLPLDKDIKRLAVLGPNANDVEALLANYNGIPADPVTPLRGIREKLKDTEVLYAMGCEHAKNLPTFQAIPQANLYTDSSLQEEGLLAKYYSNQNWEGEPAHEKVDKNVDYYWWDQAPFDDLDDDSFSIHWSGYIVPDVSGRYAIGGQGVSGWKLKVADSLIEYENPHHALKEYKFMQLEAGKKYPIDLKYFEKQGDAQMELIWAVPGIDYEKKAMEAAIKADAVVLCMGLSPRLEGEEMKVQVDGFEGGDRQRIDLPDLQQDFIKKIAELNKPMVLVMLNGSAVAINWEHENIPAIVEAWYPGQAGGQAIADVLFGDYNPAGRLPVTFYKSVNDLPDFSDYDMQGRTYKYFDGRPLYPFGYGLSYTTFNYDKPTVEQDVVSSDGELLVDVQVSNAGDMDGEEVVQLYFRRLKPQSPALKELIGFKREEIAVGQTKTIQFLIPVEELGIWNDEAGAYVVEPGTYELLVGASSREEDLLKKEITVK